MEIGKSSIILTSDKLQFNLPLVVLIKKEKIERKWYLVYVAAHYIRLLPDNFGSFIYHEEQVGNWNRTRQLKSGGFKVLQRG